MINYLLEGKETKRIIFRKLVPADFNQWLPFHQDPLSSVHWSGEHSDPHVACQNWFDATFYRYEKNMGGMNILMNKEKNYLIGQCGLLIQTVDGIQELEIGYSILPKYWNQGYATEAGRKCLEHVFDNRLSRSVIAIIHVKNIVSQKVAKNLGMSVDKITYYKTNPVYIFRINVPQNLN